MKHIKHIKSAAIILLAALVTGCSSPEAGSSEPQTSQGAPAEAKTENEQILELLAEYGEFHRDYLDCRAVKDNIEESDYVTVEQTRGAGAEDEGQPYEEYYYRVTGGEITTEAGMLEKMSALADEGYINSALMPIFENNYQVSSGNLYLREGAGNDGTTLGTDHVYLDTIEQPDEDTIQLQLIASGSIENPPGAVSVPVKTRFTVMLKRTAEGLRISECDEFAQGCLADFPVESNLPE